MKTIQDYINLGYEKSPYNDEDEFECIRTVDLTSKDLMRMLSMNLDERNEILANGDGEIVMFRAESYHILPEDIIKAMRMLDEEFDQDECESWLSLFSLKYKDRFIYSPILDEKKLDISQYYNDYLFDNPDHIISYIIERIRYDISEHAVPNFEEYELFIKETTKQSKIAKKERKYSDRILSKIIQDLCYEINTYPDHMITTKMRTFYHDKLLELAKREDYDSMRSLGYEYYEGTNGFELDPFESTYYLEKCFNISHDPELARTLGYVYYYGRTTNGVPQGDKAFQYFAIGHIAGHYYEATYKLADCYVKGYGTPICHQAAYELVNGIYDDTLTHFLNGFDSKFADVALRLGSYYKDGIYVEKNLYTAYQYYLEARCAIKTRLEHMEYVGDRGVALAISKTLDEINNKLGYHGRIVKNGGYLLEDYNEGFHNTNFKVFLDKEGYLHLEMSRNKDDKKELLHVIPQLNLAERIKKVEYIIKCAFVDDDFVKSVNSYKIKEMHFINNAIYVLFDDKKHQVMPAYAVTEEVIYVPKTIKNINKQYNIVSVEFYPGSKLYDYLCTKDDVNIGDTLTIKSQGDNKKVIVRNIKKVYEDELPLPLSKMAVAK